MQKDVILTPEGLENLKKEIDFLSTTKRREVAERIKEAREFGDISENSEYDDAKNEQAMLENRIAQLEDKLRSAQVINASELDSEVVRCCRRWERSSRARLSSASLARLASISARRRASDADDIYVAGLGITILSVTVCGGVVGSREAERVLDSFFRAAAAAAARCHF